MSFTVRNINNLDQAGKNFGEGLGEGYMQGSDDRAIRKAVESLPPNASYRDILNAVSGVNTFNPKSKQKAVENLIKSHDLELKEKALVSKENTSNAKLAQGDEANAIRREGNAIKKGKAELDAELKREEHGVKLQGYASAEKRSENTYQAKIAELDTRKATAETNAKIADSRLKQAEQELQLKQLDFGLKEKKLDFDIEKANLNHELNNQKLQTLIAKNASDKEIRDEQNRINEEYKNAMVEIVKQRNELIGEKNTVTQQNEVTRLENEAERIRLAAEANEIRREELDLKRETAEANIEQRERELQLKEQKQNGLSDQDKKEVEFLKSIKGKNLSPLESYIAGREFGLNEKQGGRVFDIHTKQGQQDRLSKDAISKVYDYEIKRLDKEIKETALPSMKKPLEQKRAEIESMRKKDLGRFEKGQRNFRLEIEGEAEPEDEVPLIEEQKPKFDNTNPEHRAKATALYEQLGDREKVRKALRKEFEI